MSCGCNNNTQLPLGPAGPQGNTGATGATGASGSNGLDGVTVLYTTSTPVSNATNVTATLQSYTIPAGQLAAIGDSIEITALFDVDITTGIAAAYVYIAGSITHIKVGAFGMSPGIKYLEVNTTITRLSATTIFCKHNSINTFSNYALAATNGSTAFYETGITINNMVTSSNLIEVKGVANTFAANTITCRHMKVIYFRHT